MRRGTRLLILSFSAAGNRIKRSTMDKSVAKPITDQALRVGDEMNRLAEAIEKIKNLEERKDFRKRFAEIAGLIYTDIMRPIMVKYPELDPDRKSL
jgi:hypothetical protein